MYKGELTEFPTQVVEKMLERQVEQGFARDLSVFESLAINDGSAGGFDWTLTVEGQYFWRSVIVEKDFDLFFEKYPKEFKWCIKMDSQEAVDYANEHGLIRPYVISEVYAHFPSYDGIGTTLSHVEDGYKELTVSELKTQILNEPETLPEFWVVFNNGEPEFQKVLDYLFEKYGKKWYSNTNYFYGFDGNTTHKGTNYFSNIGAFENNPVILTLEKFIQLTEKKMEKVIEGYKLIKPEYREAVKIITLSSAFDFEGFEKDIKEFDISLERINKAGVLDLWFEKVYKPDQTVYTMGEAGNTFGVIVKEGKALIGNANITEIVKLIQVRHKLPYYVAIEGLGFTVYDLIVGLDGFENQKASLFQWLAIKL